MLRRTTYLKMKLDASKGREFNDIIVEYNLEYDEDNGEMILVKIIIKKFLLCFTRIQSNTSI